MLDRYCVTFKHHDFGMILGSDLDNLLFMIKIMLEIGRLTGLGGLFLCHR
jgi:hypothetical protein